MRARKPNKRKPDRSEELWSGGELATLFGCDRTLVVKLHGKVFQPIDQPGQRIRTLYRLGESVRAWGAYQVNLVRNDSPTARAMETERLRKLNLDCEIKAIDLSILKGQVHLGDDVKQVIAERNMRFRSGVQALPTKLARILVGQREMSTVFRLISAECEELLRNLAEYKASDYLVKNPEVLARLLKEEKDAAERTAQLQRTIEFFTDIDGILAPPSRQSLSEWSDKNRILPRTAAEPGIWRTAKTPYMRSIMDAYSDPSVQRIVVMGASQIGKTESLILNAIAFHIDQDPCDILLVLPTQDALERLSKKRLGALFRDTECIRSKVSAAKSRSGDATLYYRGYDGGSITLASPVPSQLAGDPYRVLLLDEIDRYATTREGDPIELAIKRASTFWNRKIVLISSPTSEETSRILAAYRHSTREEYHVPCPICDRLQVLSWDRIEFGPPIRHRCEHCQGLSEQHEWAARSQFGKWVARNPGHRTRGFHINALVSPWIEWDDLRREFLDAVALMKVGDFSSMQVFRNTRMAEPWGPPGEKLDVEELWQRREIYEAEVPAGVLLITAGVDIQDGRIVAEVAGWGVDRERWALGYHIFYGNTLEADVWCELAELLDKDFVRADGVKLQILKMFVDSGRHASVVYRWTKPRQPRAFSIKGRGGPGLPIIASKSQVKDGSYATLVSLGSDSIKDQMQIRLNQQEPGPIFCHYPKLAEGGADRGYDEEYFDGLCSEKCVTRYRGGQPVPSWEKTAHASNEPLDCFCYGFAALEFAGGLSALQRAATAIETMIRPPTTVGSGSPGSPFGSVPNRNPREHERPRGWAPGARPSSEESESPFGTYRPKSGRGH